MRLVHFSPSHPGGSGQTWFEVRWTDNLTANTTWSKFAFYNCLNFQTLCKSGRHSAFKIWSGRLWRGTDSHSLFLSSPHLLSITQYGPSHCHPKSLSNNFSPPAGSTVREWARSDLAGSSANIPSESDRFRWIQIFDRIKPNQSALHQFNWNCSQWPIM